MVSRPFGATTDGLGDAGTSAEVGVEGTVQRSFGRFPGFAVFEQTSRVAPAEAVASIFGHVPPAEAADADVARPGVDTATRKVNAPHDRRDRKKFMRP